MIASSANDDRSLRSECPSSSIKCSGRWLIVEYPAPREMLSWAIVGGGRTRASTVVWHQVDESELRPPIQPRSLLRRRLAKLGLSDAVAMMTSRDVRSYVRVEERLHDVAVQCIATVGLGNALRVGDPVGPTAQIGTINLLCSISVRLSDEALVETLAMAAEARTLALVESGIGSRISGKPATGTGTDCIVVAAPVHGTSVRYVGKHTLTGHLIGKAVVAAVEIGVARWQDERCATNPPA